MATPVLNTSFKKWGKTLKKVGAPIGEIDLALEDRGKGSHYYLVVNYKKTRSSATVSQRNKNIRVQFKTEMIRLLGEVGLYDDHPHLLSELKRREAC